tara:strand:+ start:1271 stop:2056 length:786 start_codon:yes stop_codon:yes gene_type:complete
MAVDFDAIKRKLDQLSGNNRKTSSNWRPQEGEEYAVRLLSFPDNDGQPFKEQWFYYNIGNNRGILAPYQFGKPDPFQELITKLRDEGTKESYELAKKLYPKMRCYAPVLVRGEEDKGVRIWGFGKMVYQSLLNVMLDEDYGDITDPLNGRDVKVICTRQPGRKWATTEVRPRGKESKLAENPEEVSNLISSIPDLGEMHELKSYDELSKIINDWLNGDIDSDTEGSGSTPAGASGDSDSETTDTDSKSYKNLDDAFADLMD